MRMTTGAIISQAIDAWLHRIRTSDAQVSPDFSEGK